MSGIDLKKLPKHVGIIMDGNGRWATKRFMPRIVGHREGMKRVNEIVESSCNLGIKVLTLYAFSTENWKRSEDEVNGLMDILTIYINSQLKRIIENNIIFRVIGDYQKLPLNIVDLLDNAINKTQHNTGMILNIALNYGGRLEIIDAINKICKEVNDNQLDLKDVDENKIKEYLYTKENSDVDLIIRTGGEKRVSNFLIYQIAYSELFFSDTLWPDFRVANFHEAISDFQNRNRRFGGV